jgi:hypothetical protein
VAAVDLVASVVVRADTEQPTDEGDHLFAYFLLGDARLGGRPAGEDFPQRVAHSDGAAHRMSSFCGGPRPTRAPHPSLRPPGCSGLSVLNVRAGRRPAAALTKRR